MADLKKRDITRYIKHCQQENLSSNIVSLRLTVLKVFAEWLWLENLLESHQYQAIKSLSARRERNNDNRTALTEEEVKDYLRIIADLQLWMMFWVGANYGLRCEKYTKLKISDVLEERILTRRLSKGNKTRKIRLLSKHLILEYRL